VEVLPKNGTNGFNFCRYGNILLRSNGSPTYHNTKVLADDSNFDVAVDSRRSIKVEDEFAVDIFGNVRGASEMAYLMPHAPK
jgi:hypothetical protein